MKFRLFGFGKETTRGTGRGRVPFWVLPMFLAVLTAAVIWSQPVPGQQNIPITERDYQSDEKRSIHGWDPIVGDDYTLSLNRDEFFKRITFTMARFRSILVEINPVNRPAGIIMLGSQPGTPRNFRPLWVNDDLKTPIRFWTHTFWQPHEACSPVGCPMLRFQVLQGEASVLIVDVKDQPFKY